MNSRSISIAAAPARLTPAVLPLVLYCVGHFMVDLYSSALGVLQPLLVDQFQFNFTQAGILAGVLVFSSSVMQPFYGYLSDRFHSRLFSALGPAVAGIFIASLGWAPHYWALLAMALAGGAGIASFHPQAATNAMEGIRENRGRAMAVFICSGTVGLAVGPSFFSAIAGGWGLAKTPIAAVPGIVVTVLMVALLRPAAKREQVRRKNDWSGLRAVWKPMLILYLLVFIRSIVQITFTQFLPLYLHTERGYTLAAASYSLSFYLLGGALGGLAGGSLADRLGGRLVILISMIGSVPFLALFVFGSGVASTIGLVLGGMILLFTIPVNVVMAQEMVPEQAGTVSALMMGFAWGTAGIIFIPLTGWIADLFSMQVAFAGLIAFPLIGILPALKLPAKSPAK